MAAPLTSVSNQFVFNLPADFVLPDIEEKLKMVMKKNRMVHDSVYDYLNSSIKNVTLPNFTYPYSTQKIKHGKEVHWRGATSVYDTVTQQIDVTFSSFDSHINYMMIRQCLAAHYLNVKSNYVSPLTVTMIDIYRNPITSYTFRSILPLSISELALSYSDVRAEEKTFTVQFQFSWMDIEFFDGSEILRMDDPKSITSEGLDKIPTNLLAN